MPYKDKNKERAHRKEYYFSNKDKVKFSAMKSQVKRRFGLTLDEYLEMKASTNQCEICNKQFSNDRKGSTQHLDHDHVTGKVRGLLCNNCNTGLGLFEDNTLSLQAAIKYLQRK